MKKLGCASWAVIIALAAVGGWLALCLWCGRDRVLVVAHAPNLPVSVRLVARPWLLHSPIPYCPVNVVAIIQQDQSGEMSDIEVCSEDILEDAVRDFSSVAWNGSVCSFLPGDSNGSGSIDVVERIRVKDKVRR